MQISVLRRVQKGNTRLRNKQNKTTVVKEGEIYILPEGTLLCNGKYIIQRRIGIGGFGITYMAIQNGLNRIVCIKEYFPSGKCARDTVSYNIYPQTISNEYYYKYRESFEKEARILAELSHPNIVEVIDVFGENNTSYMVMEYIKGESLQKAVENRGRLPYTEAVNYIAQIADAVDYIHKRHILHRDIKPDNIMLTASYKAILIDFGSAREFEEDKTQIHTSMFTNGYAPPEQYASKSRKGSYTDIYALGATFYFTLTGQAPLEATARLIDKMPEPKKLVKDIPEEANRTILKAMQLKSENRHQTIDDFMADLRNIRPSVLIDETIGAKSKKWVIPVSIISTLIVAAAITVFLILGKNGENVKTTDSMGTTDSIETIDFTGTGMYPMIYVEGGTFEMGNDNSDNDCPTHEVTLDGYYIGQFEVSRKFFKSIMGYDPSLYATPDADNYPVENVSIEEAKRFIEMLNRKTRKHFALPTEAQWEYAARGGQSSRGYSYSGTADTDKLWYDRDNPTEIYYEPSVNELGIYQMSGNVAEWCRDYYDESFYYTGSRYNPVNSNGHDGDLVVIRGGSYYSFDEEELTVFYRNAYDSPQEDIGFRLVLEK